MRKSVARLTTVLHAGTDRVRISEADRALHGWFAALNATRSWHQAGPNPITYGEIAAYAELTRQTLEPHHVAAIRAVDDAWIAATHKRMGNGTPAPGRAGGALNPAAFDAVFG